MRRRFLLLVPFFLNSALPASEGQSGWQAGVAKQAITPPEPMWMSGYASRTHEATGTAHDLWAKALVLQDPAGKQSVLITLDLSGIGRDTSVDVCAKLKESHGLERSQIAMSTSHTHSGPVVRTLGRTMYNFDKKQKELVDRYGDLLVERILKAVDDAISSIQPATISVGSGSTDIAVNRRNNREADVVKLRETGELKGPVDHSVPVLAVTTTSGNLSAIVFGYACHATVVSFYEWSGDWPGYSQIEIEKRHPGTIALFVAGCGADQNPLPRRTVELSEGYGRKMAAAVDVALNGDMRQVQGKLHTEYKEISLPYHKLPSRDGLKKELKSSNKYYASRAKMLLGKLDRDGQLEPAYSHYPVQTWGIGNETRVVFLGGEVVVDYSLRLRNEFDGRSLWVAGYSNDVMAYIPSERVLMEGGYEGGGAMVYFGLPSAWATGVEDNIVNTVKSQVQAIDSAK